MQLANGLVLDKSRKLYHDWPSLFIIIVPPQNIPKILERMVAAHLSAIAIYVSLLHHNQCGSLSSLSSFDACTALLDTVSTLGSPALKVSFLFFTSIVA